MGLRRPGPQTRHFKPQEMIPAARNSAIFSAG